MQTRRILILALSVLATSGQARGDVGDLWQLYARRDFFSLRDRMPRRRGAEPPRLFFLRAATEASFGHHAAAISDLHHVIDRRPDRDLRTLAGWLLMREERAEGRYADALAAIEPLMLPGANSDADQADLRNTALMLAALSKVAPQALENTTDAVVIQRRPDGRFPAAINGHDMDMGFDTGAAFSFLAASTARKAGLQVRRIGMSLGSSTGVDAGADIAIANVAIGPVLVRNVVFLVLPDAGLTMSDGFFMPGLLGFPVMSALGPIQHVNDGSVRLGGPRAAPEQNLALDGGRVLVRVGFKGEKLLCRLDTGADNTVFYAPFYRRFPKLFADPSGDRVLKIGGVSGAQNIPAYQLSSVDFTLAGKAVHLTQPNVLEMSVEAKGDDYLDCNIGMDALRSFGSYSIDLKHLHLGLEAAG